MKMSIDFRMDKISWVFLILMMAIFMYFILQGGSDHIVFWGYVQAFFIALLTLISLIAIVSIPVVIVCYFIQKIPDIDYSIWAAFGITIIGLITELF